MKEEDQNEEYRDEIKSLKRALVEFEDRERESRQEILDSQRKEEVEDEKEEIETVEDDHSLAKVVPLTNFYANPM